MSNKKYSLNTNYRYYYDVLLFILTGYRGQGLDPYNELDPARPVEKHASCNYRIQNKTSSSHLLAFAAAPSP